MDSEWKRRNVTELSLLAVLSIVNGKDVLIAATTG
jgi:hypothetical protein